MAKNSYRSKVIKFVKSNYSPNQEINSSVVANDMNGDNGRISTILREMVAEGLLNEVRKEVAGKRWRYVYMVKSSGLKADTMANFKRALLREYTRAELLQELMGRELDAA